MLPGETAKPANELTVTNSGDVDLAVKVTIDAAFTGYEFRALIVGLGQTCGSLAGASLPALTNVVNAAEPVIIVPKHTAMTLCTEVKALTTITPTTPAANFAINLNGTQVR